MEDFSLSLSDINPFQRLAIKKRITYFGAWLKKIQSGSSVETQHFPINDDIQHIEKYQ